ncbi:MAG: cation diffusion facilitator family transporter, partial [Patescibacteria group bacterium]
MGFVGASVLVLVILGGIASLDVVGSILSGSRAIISDLGHVGMDLSAQALVFLAVWNPFRWSRAAGAKIALINGILLFGAGCYFLFAGFKRLLEPQEVESLLMIAFATGGLAGNILVVWLRRQGRKQNIAVESGYLHALFDTIGSIGLVGGGALIAFTNQFWLDGVLMLGISLMIFWGATRLLNDSWHTLHCSTYLFGVGGPTGCQRVYCLRSWTT